MNMFADLMDDPAQTKQTLKQKGEQATVRLKTKDPSQEMEINLSWQTRADLDLGCFYALRPRTTVAGGFMSRLRGVPSQPKSVIDGLQFAHGQGGPRDRVTRQGCYTQEPWIWHTGDDRSGAASEGESILVNPRGVVELQRMTIYATIYEGVARWAETDAVVAVRVPGAGEVVVELGRQASTLPFVAIAELRFHADARLDVERLVTFHLGHAECDRAHGWGLSWTAGSK